MLKKSLTSLLCFVLSLTLLLPCQAQAALFGSFGIKDEIELGRKFAVLIRSRLPLIEDPEIKVYVQSIVDKLAAGIPPQPFKFESSVMLADSINAFAVPGGYVFVHTGLIMEFEKESELAGVLAHELAHVTQRHVASRMERAQVATVGSLVGMLAGALLGGGQSGSAIMAGSMAASQSAMLNYSRGDETESDQVGLQYLTKAGYNPNGMVSAFNKIRSKQWASGREIPEYLSTHPDVNNRITEAAARVKTLPITIQNRPENDEKFKRVRTLIWARYGDPDLANQVFAKGKEDGLNLMGKGILAARRNRLPEAEQHFTKALEIAKNDALIWREAGRFYYTKGDPRASQTLQKALSLDKNDAMAQFFYARTLDGAKRKLDAHKYYEQVLRYVPEDSEVHFVYGRSLGEAGQHFLAYLHLTYSAMYENNEKKTMAWLKQTKDNIRTKEDKTKFERLENALRERSAFWRNKYDQ